MEEQPRRANPNHGRFEFRSLPMLRRRGVRQPASTAGAAARNLKVPLPSGAGALILLCPAVVLRACIGTRSP